MKVRFNERTLLPSVQAGFKVSAKDDVIPAYAHVRMVAGQNSLQFEFANSRCEFVSSAPAEVDEPGVAIVDSSTFGEILKASPDGAVFELHTDSEFLYVKRGLFNAKLALFRESEYPVLNCSTASFGESLKFELPPRVFSILEETKLEGFQAFTELSGILFDYEDGILRFAGFNPVMVCIAFIKSVVAHQDTKIRVVIPADILEILPVFVPGIDTVQLYIDPEGTKILVTNGDTHIRFGLVEDKFPRSYVKELGILDPFKDDFVAVDVKKGKMKSETEVITSPRTSFVFEVEDLMHSIKSVASVMAATDVTIIISIKSKVKEGLVAEVLGENRLTGSEASDKILAQGDLENELNIGLSKDRLKDIIKRFGTDRAIRFWIKDELASIIFSEVEPMIEDVRLVGMLMPQRMFR